MKEIIFLNKNAKRWEKFDKILNNTQTAHNPDEIADLYIQITDDLAYARTYYPKSKTTKYLNNLALKAHRTIYVNKKEKTNRIITFWKTEYPLLIHKNSRYLLYSFAIFIVSVLIGITSTANDDQFIRLILGDTYVNMTLQNIEKGDPMAVYKQAKQLDMSVAITINNIRVSFIAFIYGLFLSFGTGYILFFNGIMLGSFFYFFYQHGLLYEATLTVWIHGAIEITAIIVAGAAGICMGNSIMFPGTYSRWQSFSRGAKQGMKIVFGMFPFFIVAGFIEGFITRYTETPDIFRLTFILGSLYFMLWYLIIYPKKVYEQQNE